MDSTSSGLDFAVIGHQDNWHNISAFINDIRVGEQDKLSLEKIRNIFSFIPPRDLFRVRFKSKTGTEVNGVYIDTFIDPDKLDAQFIRINVDKVKSAISHAKKLGARIVALGGFTSIVLEGNLHSFSTGETKFTTGNSLTAAYIVKGIERAAFRKDIDLRESSILIVGASGDIGTACISYLKAKVKKILLCARNKYRLEKLSQELEKEDISVKYSLNMQDLIPEADVIIGVASSTGMELTNCKRGVLICDAGYPKNLEASVETRFDLSLFHGGMGQLSHGYSFNPDYSKSIYRYAAPNVIHGCILEAVVLAFERKFEDYSSGRGNITIDSMEKIYHMGLKHGIDIAPFYNANGLWRSDNI